MKYTVCSDDTFFTEEVRDVFDNVNGIELREFEGSEYVNFSNMVRVTATSESPVLGIEVGTLLLVHHRVKDSVIPLGEDGDATLVYEEDIFAIGESKDSFEIENFKFLDDYYLTEEIPDLGIGYDGSFELKNESSRTYSKLFGTDDILVEYVLDSDYEIYLGETMYYVIAKSNVLNKMVKFDDSILCRAKDVYTSSLTGSRWIREVSILGFKK